MSALDVTHCGLDEIGRPEQARMQLHCSFSNQGFQFVHARFQVLGDRMGIGAELALDHQEHAGVPSIAARHRGCAPSTTRATSPMRTAAAFAVGEQFARNVGRRMRLGVGLPQEC